MQPEIRNIDVTDDEGPPRTLIEATCRRLTRDIVECRYGPGDKLRIAELKEQYQVSGSTLREALSLLVSQSLVVSEEQRGFWVAPMSLEDMEDLTCMRVMLECSALERSIAHGDDDWEAVVVSSYHKLSLSEKRLDAVHNFDEWEQRNSDFHEALLAACTSKWTHRFRHTLYKQLERYRRLTAMHGAPSRRIHQEHAELFDAAIKRDAGRATTALANHINATLASACKLDFLRPSTKQRRGAAAGDVPLPVEPSRAAGPHS